MFPGLIFGSNKNPGAREIMGIAGRLRIITEIIKQLTGDESVPRCLPGLPCSHFVSRRRVPPMFFEPILECFLFRHTCFSIFCATLRKARQPIDYLKATRLTSGFESQSTHLRFFEFHQATLLV